MGREVRRVHKDWVHPEGARLHDAEFLNVCMKDWHREKALWDKGLVEWDGNVVAINSLMDEDDPSTYCETFEEWYGPKPDLADYMPNWTEKEKTHFQMYETTTEGTPISPVFATIEELARWLADTGASAFGGMTATYEQWLAMCRQGCSAVGMMFSKETGLISGVAAVSKESK